MMLFLIIILILFWYIYYYFKLVYLYLISTVTYFDIIDYFTNITIFIILFNIILRYLNVFVKIGLYLGIISTDPTVY